MKPIIIGTRGSDLALAQTRWVMTQLQPRLDIPLEIRIIQTAGDQTALSDFNLPASSSSSSPGIFTRALEVELLAGRIDVAVHSLKDMPLGQSSGLMTAAIPLRAQPGDLLAINPLAFNKSGEQLPLFKSAVVGTSSPRRQAQVKAQRNDLRLINLRGNLPTRLNKVRSREVEAAVIAEAGWERLCRPFPDLVYHRLDTVLFVPAPGQGALAIQTRIDDPWAEAYRSILHHFPTAACVEAERKLLARFGGGCAQPLGALVLPKEGGYQLRGFYQTTVGPCWGQLETDDLESGLDKLYKILSSHS